MIYQVLVNQFPKMLKNLINILDMSNEFADSKKIDFDVLLNSRLAPDQFALIRQIQIACDTAKLAASRLSGKEAPKHDDNEKNLNEIKNRINEVISYLKNFKDSDFKNAEMAKISQPRWEGKYLNGDEFFIEHVLPNFYFHITTAYSILRHNGINIGKKNYLGDMPFKQ